MTLQPLNSPNVLANKDSLTLSPSPSFPFQTFRFWEEGQSPRSCIDQNVFSYWRRSRWKEQSVLKCGEKDGGRAVIRRCLNAFWGGAWNIREAARLEKKHIFKPLFFISQPFFSLLPTFLVCIRLSVCAPLFYFSHFNFFRPTFLSFCYFCLVFLIFYSNLSLLDFFFLCAFLLSISLSLFCLSSVLLF